MAFTKLGALWFKKLDDGREFTNGVITIDGKETRISLIANRYKTEAKHPDWILVLDERGSANGGALPAARPAAGRFGRPAPAPAPARAAAPVPDNTPVYDPNDPGDYVPPDDGVPF
jgi:hypothetical protein